MNTKFNRTTLGKLVVTGGLVTFALVGGAARAAGEADPHGFNDIKPMIAKMAEMTDKNKDGSVTKEEYLSMQGRLFDTASKKRGKMSMEEFKAFMKEFSVYGPGN